MTFKDFQARCLRDVALNEGVSSDRALIVPQRAEVGLPCTIDFGPSTAAIIDGDDGASSQRRCTAIGLRDDLRDLIRQIIGQERDVEMGDSLLVENGAFEGEWQVESSHADGDGSITMQVRWEQPYAVAAKGVRPL